MKISINLQENNNEFIAICPELEINCYGTNKNEAIRRIKNVLQFYIHSAKELGLDVEKVESLTVEGKKVNISSNTSISYIPHSLN